MTGAPEDAEDGEDAETAGPGDQAHGRAAQSDDSARGGCETPQRRVDGRTVPGLSLILSNIQLLLYLVVISNCVKINNVSIY